MKSLTQRDLPLSGDPSSRFLPLLIAFMVFLAALALVGAEVLRQTAERWESGLSGQMTVQLAAEEGQAEPEQVATALALLQDVPGVTSVEVLERAEAAALLEPWLGEAAQDPALPVPLILTLSIEGPVSEVAAEARTRLAEALPSARLDDHQEWIGGLLDLTRGLGALAIFLLLLVGAAAVVTVVFVTRSGLAVHRPVIELLHLMGARDAQVAGRFQLHALRQGFLGGLLGLATAALCYGLLDWTLAPTTLALLPPFTIGPRLLILLALLPVIAGIVGFITARITVLRTLARMP